MQLSISRGKLVALDWDRKFLRMVLVRPRADGVDLLRAVSVAIPDDVSVEDPAAFGGFVREAMSRTGVGAKRAMLSIAREQVVLNNLSLPPTPPEEMPSLVQFQIAKELPFAAEEATLDFAVDGEFDPKAPSNVLVAAVRSSELDYYKAVAQQAGLTVERIGLRPFANLIAVTSKTPDLADKAFLVVEVGPNLTEIDIVRQGRLSFSRAASLVIPPAEELSAESIKDSRIVTMQTVERPESEATQKVIAELMVEIVRSVEAYRATDPGLSLDRIIVCGATGLETFLVQALAARFATNAELFSPARAMDLAPQRAKELRGFNAALGLAISHDRKGVSFIDFLHPKKPVSRRAMRMKKVPVAAATIAVFIGSGVVFHVRFVAPQTALAAQRDRERANLKKQEEPIVRFKEQVEALEAWNDSERHWPEVLAAVTEVFPPETEAYVSRLDLDMAVSPKTALREASLKLRFRTASLGTVNAFTSKLRESGFTNIVPGKETPSEMNRDGYRYDTNVDAVIPLRSSFAEPAPANADASVSKEPPQVNETKKAPSETATVAQPTSRRAGS